MKCLFEGSATALVTPFSCGKVDNFALENLIEKCIVEGVKAIVVLGTTGESATVTDDERVAIIKLAKKTIAGRVKLIVGTGSNNFEKAYQYTLLAKEFGVDGALVVSPYYNKTSQDGIIEYYKRLCEIKLPIIMYNVPSRTGLNIEIDTIKRLANLDMIYGLKESTSDIDRIINLSQVCKNKIALYSGEDHLNYIFYALGGQGTVSVTANAFPMQVQKVFDLVQLGLFKDASQLQNKLQGINKALFCQTNPIPIKYLLSTMGLCKNELRLPLIPISTNGKKIIEKQQKRLSL
ncbi:MAG: 4-hydroxy-tetrahydrodipicolinate synthase [Clostridiales bacterium]|nr:4-hydroxy-tetrahydrodipicolinate synthase [Clostridiales bacterium]